MSGKILISFTCFFVLDASAGPSISLEAAKALDTDGSGKVELNEIVSFARSHGLDVQAVQSEFATFDRDQDGTLDISELNATLADDKPSAEPTAEKVTLRTKSQSNANEVTSQADMGSSPSISQLPQSAQSASQTPQSMVKVPDQLPQSAQSASQTPQSMVKVHEQTAGAGSTIRTHSQVAAPTNAAAASASAEIPASAAQVTATSAPQSSAADVTAAQSMIKALDTDGSGVVEKAEVDAFAQSQGLSAAETADEFKDLDKNHDGQLDSSEISSTVAQYTSTAAPVVATKESPVAAPVVAAKESPVTKAAPVPAKAPAAMPAAAPVIAPKELAKEAVAPPAAESATETGLTPIEPADVPLDPDEISKTLIQNRAQADRTVAQLFALKASNDLAKRDKDLEEAKALEQKAAALRGQAAKVAADAIESAEVAAQKIGRNIMEKALEDAQQLENQAKKVEGRAASINAKAKVAMAQAMKAQSSASKAVEELVTAATKIKD